MIDPSIQARTAAAIYARGQSVTVSRWSQPTPASPTRTQSPPGGAQVTAMVKDAQPDGTTASAAGYGMGQPGAVTDADRFILVMAADLTAAGFALPVQKGDQLVLSLTGETVTVVRSDPHKRQIAGAIEIWAVGVL